MKAGARLFSQPATSHSEDESHGMAAWPLRRPGTDSLHGNPRWSKWAGVSTTPLALRWAAWGI